jgi:hypothetical protein
MSTTVELPSPTNVAYYTAGILGAGVALEERDDGTGYVRGLKVFRTGKLKDSRGNEFTWEPNHLKAAVDNFNALRGELPHVPVRAGHTRDVNQVVGYYEALRTDGRFLIADLDITEPDAFAKIKRKTYRGRSLEIGVFDSASGLTWPTVLGLAFVDIPAVSGLYESPVGGTQFTLITESESMADDTKVLEWAMASHYAQGLADAPKPPELPKFQCYGAEVLDYSAVQEHIDTLEKAVADTRDAGRKSFVEGLVTDKKILATQREHFEKLVLGMSSEQFELFTQGFVDAPGHSLLASHGPGGTQTVNNGDDPAAEHVKDLEAIVSYNRRLVSSGVMTPEQFEKTPSYVELQQLKNK